MKRRERPAWYYFGGLWLILMPFVIAFMVWARIIQFVTHLF